MLHYFKDWESRSSFESLTFATVDNVAMMTEILFENKCRWLSLITEGRKCAT